jgi:acyl-coenzyme A synthetase/AMP-(fatty) acid ligase
VSEKAIRDFALMHGPAYAHPRRVFFVDALPLNGAAKTDRLQVKALVGQLMGGAELGRDEVR